MAPPDPPANKGGPNAKHYIVAALTATLAVAAIITIFFIVLSPARVVFSVTHAGVSHRYEDGSRLELALTVAANNTSRRAAVVYQTMFVDVINHTDPMFMDVNSVEARLRTHMPLVQRRLSVENISATVLLVGETEETFTSNMTNNHFSITVTAEVRFKVGFARTRIYDIVVICKPVKFFAGGGGGRGAKKRTGAAHSQPPVQCA